MEIKAVDSVSDHSCLVKGIYFCIVVGGEKCFLSKWDFFFCCSTYSGHWEKSAHRRIASPVSSSYD